MTKAPKARVAFPCTALLLLCLHSGCYAFCAGDTGDERCAEFACNEAICEGDTVVWCPCGEDPDGGMYAYMERADCAARDEKCVVASDGSDGSLREAICLDSCDTPEEFACREGESGPILLSCEPYDVDAPCLDEDDCESEYEDEYGVDPGAPHEGTYTSEIHPESTYEGLFEWGAVGMDCTSCESSCGCEDGDHCQDGLCVPGEPEDGLVCCEGENGDPCTTGTACENADGSQGVCGG